MGGQDRSFEHTAFVQLELHSRGIVRPRDATNGHRDKTPARLPALRRIAGPAGRRLWPGRADGSAPGLRANVERRVNNRFPETTEGRLVRIWIQRCSHWWAAKEFQLLRFGQGRIRKPRGKRPFPLCTLWREAEGRAGHGSVTYRRRRLRAWINGPFFSSSFS